MATDVSKFLLLALCLGGCAATRPTPNVDAFAQRSASNSFEVFDRHFQDTGLVLGVMHDQQTSPASCGANALASIVNYWRGPGAVSGDAIYRATPPADPAIGYSLAELTELARSQGLLVSAARLSQEQIIHEL